MSKPKPVGVAQEDLYEEFQSYLQIDRNNLDNEIMRQSSLFFAVSEAAVRLGSRRDYLKDTLARIDASLYSKHKNRLEKTSGKATENAIQQAILNDDAHITAKQSYLEAATNADLYGTLKEAFQQRAYMLRELASLYVAKYYESDSFKAKGDGKEIRAEKVQRLRVLEDLETVGKPKVRRRKRENL